uniref:t-SNARE coiled-coil homology domain-containing protein n=1 Tax=Romanomermis culicivorax TaxID=13658 RepID=A0A915KMF6_ROMCU
QTSATARTKIKLKNLSETAAKLEKTDSRRQFIEETKDSVERLRSKMSGFDSRFKATSPLTSSFRYGAQISRSDDQGTSRNLNMYKYSKLENEDKHSANDPFIDDVLSQQKLILKNQDENLGKVSDSVHILKDMSHRIGVELDEQSIMIDDLAHETERTHSRLDVVMKKLIKVTNMSDDRRQWQVIGILVVILLIIIILFFV